MTAAKPPGQRRGNPRGPQPAPIAIHGPLGMTAPDDLGTAGADMWEYVASQTRWLQPSDTPVLRLLCDAADRREVLMADVRHRGVVVEAKQGPLPNPALTALTALEKQMTTWMSLLGLSPSDRGRMGLSAAKTESTLNRLRSRRAQSPQDGSGATQDSELNTDPTSG